jgi:hypothetical protein
MASPTAITMAAMIAFRIPANISTMAKTISGKNPTKALLKSIGILLVVSKS